MKHTRTFKHVLLSLLLILTLTAAMLSVSAAETTAAVQNPTAKLTVTSVKTGETVETLYALAEGAFYAADLEAQSHDKTVTITLLAPMKGYTFECGIGDFTSPITVDLGGYHHYIRHLSVVGQSTLTLRNGNITTVGAFGAQYYGLTVNNPQATVILEKDVAVFGADRNTAAHAEGADDVILETVGTIPVRVCSGALVNHGTVVGGTSATAIQNDGGEVYNHGTVLGGSGTANNPAYTFDTGIGVDGASGVTLNTGLIRGGDYVSEIYDENVLMTAPAVYGIVGENRGEIIGGSIKANSPEINSAPAVYGAVGINSGTIRGGDALSAAEQGSVYAAAGIVGWKVLNAGKYGYDVDYYHDAYTPIEAVVIDNQGTISNGSAAAEHEAVEITHANAIVSRGDGSYEVLYNSGSITANGGVTAIDDTTPGLVVYQNNGTITPVSFEQAYLTVYMDGEIITGETLPPFYDGKERAVTYSLTFGGKEVSFDDVTSSLTLDGKEVTTLLESGKYVLTVTHGEESKTYPLSIRPAHPFTDIADDHPYYADIAGVYQKGLMNGTEPNVFSPDTTLSRAMLVTMLWRMEGMPYVNYAMQFTDVAEEEWYTEAIRWAAAEGIVLGYDDGTFGIDNPITLEQLSVMLYRYEQYKGGGFTGLWMFRLNYDDAADISDWAYESVCYMVMKNIYCIPAEHELQPQKPATRADAAVFLNRYDTFRSTAAAEE